MTSAEEQEMLSSLRAISEDMRTLVVLVRELTMQQSAADQKALNQLVTIAHRRV